MRRLYVGWNKLFSAIARQAVAAAGSAVVTGLAVLAMVTWTAVGVVRGFTQHWLDVLYALTGSVTFIMVFLIQHTTSMETRAILLKLDELVRATEGAANDVIEAEQRTVAEQDALRDRLESSAEPAAR
jgi:low affinity Fe/Cu permease